MKCGTVPATKGLQSYAEYAHWGVKKYFLPFIQHTERRQTGHSRPTDPPLTHTPPLWAGQQALKDQWTPLRAGTAPSGGRFGRDRHLPGQRRQPRMGRGPAAAPLLWALLLAPSVSYGCNSAAATEFYT